MTNNRSHQLAGVISRNLPVLAALLAAFIPAALFASEAVQDGRLDLTMHTVGYPALGYGTSILVHMQINAAHFS